MTKRQILAGTVAAFLLTGVAMVDAQGRRGPAGLLGLQQGPPLGGRPGQMLGAPGRGFGGRLGGRGRGPLAGLAAVGLTDDQKAKLKTIVDAERAEQLAARERTHNAIAAILTPEQKAKLGWK